ncbi:hypothetical protein [Endozoicomonas sp. 4G]|nr:hypothetical protein [Endozoicomonas sp. 4G]
MKTNRVPNRPAQKDRLKLTEADIKALIKLSEKAYKNAKKSGYRPEFL